MEILKEPEKKEIAEMIVAFVSFVGNYIGNAEIFAELFGKLSTWAGPKGLMENTQFLSVYRDNPKEVKPEDLTLETCMTLNEDIEVDGEIKKQTLPAGNFLVMDVEIKPSEYGDAWEYIANWMKKNNLEIAKGRACYELYLNDPKQHPKGLHQVRLCMPI